MKKWKEGILFLNFGSPAELSLQAVKNFYHHFFSDADIFDISPAGRFILREIIAKRKRSKKILEEYRMIWNHAEALSPLEFHTRNFLKKLKERLPENVHVAHAHLYSPPFIEDALTWLLKEKGAISLRVFFMSFQHCASVTGSALKKVIGALNKLQVFPELHFEYMFWSEKTFLDVIVAHIIKHSSNLVLQHSPIVFSFHGVPERHIKRSGLPRCFTPGCCNTFTEENFYCYRAQCFHMASSIATELGLRRWHVAFQSQFGKDKWIEPSLIEKVREILDAGEKHIVVVPLSFPFDCLETLYELNIELRKEVEERGAALTVIPALNDSDDFVSLILNKIHRS